MVKVELTAQQVVMPMAGVTSGWLQDVVGVGRELRTDN